MRILTFAKLSVCFCLDDFFLLYSCPGCRAIPDQPGANGAARCRRNGTGWSGESPLLLWLHLPVQNRDELTPAGFSLSLGGYYSFLPGICWIQWGCLNSTLRPKRARPESSQSLAHFPHRSSAMWRWGKLNKAALKNQGCPPFPGMQLVPVPSSAGFWLGRERSANAPARPPRRGHAHTNVHVCV